MKSNASPSTSSKQLSHRNVQQFNNERNEMSERDALRKKIEEQRRLEQEYMKKQQMRNEQSMDTESYIGTESYMTQSVRYDSEGNIDGQSVRSKQKYTQRRHRSVDTVTTKASEAAYEPSIFTDIDYDIDYDNVGIKDIVWTQKLKYLKNRLIFLEREISDLPQKHKKMDKLMLYSALEFLSINPDEKKANDHLVEWWDLHKYSWLDRHDPTRENTM